jgi:hypothetical protein
MANISGSITFPGSPPWPSYASISACNMTDCYYTGNLSDGTFSVQVAAGSSYLLSFGVSNNNPVVGGYYTSGAAGNFGIDRDKATAIAVTAAGVTGIDITPPPPVILTGHLTGPSASLVQTADVHACVVGLDGFCYTASSSYGGNYALRVAPGQHYTISVADQAGLYAAGYYDVHGAGSFTLDQRAATRVAVATSDISGLDVALGATVLLYGNLLDSDYYGLGGGEVMACDVYRCYQTSAAYDSGFYSIRVPANDVYYFYYFDGTWTYAPGYLSGGNPDNYSPDPAEATWLAIGTSLPFDGIDIALPLGVHVSGKITASGANMADVLVFACPSANIGGCIHDTSRNGTGIWLSPNTDGTYSTRLAPNHTYYLYVWDTSATHLSGFWSSGGFTSTLVPAAALAVGTASRTGINVTLPSAIHVAGQVKRGNGDGARNLDVWACVSGTDTCFYALSMNMGYYSVAVLPNKNYVLEFDDWSFASADGFYDTAGAGNFTDDQGQATPVGVATSSVTASTVVLPEPIQITGRVTDSHSTPLPGIWTYACTVAITGPCYWAISDDDGAYTIAAAPNETYYVYFADPMGVYADGYYSTAGYVPDLASATGVPATTVDVLLLDVELPTAVVISGSVTNRTPIGLPDIEVSACLVSSPDSCYYDYTDADGAYSVTVASDHSYILEFDDPAGLYYGGFYSSTGYTADEGSATPVVLEDDDVSGIDVVLPRKPGATYTAVEPYRVLDSRYDIGGHQFASRVKQTVTIATDDSGVPTDAVAVTGNVTVTGQTNAGYVTVAPSLTSGVQPPTSTLNFPNGDTRANGVTVSLASDGKLDFMYWSSRTSDRAQVIFDVTGYFTNDTSGATYYTATPYRVLDSRYGIGGSQFVSQIHQTVTIATDDTHVPDDAVAVTGNVTIVGQTYRGYITVAPTLTDHLQPPTSTLNFPAGDIRANGITVPLAAGGNLDFMYWSTRTSDKVQVIFDVTGYFMNGGGGATYYPVTPARVLDSRYNIGAGRFSAQIKQTVLTAGGLSGVPIDALGLTGNVTVTGQTNKGYITVDPSLTSHVQPPTSTLNFPVGDTRANGLTVPLAEGGNLDFIYWSSRTSDRAQVIFDVTGYFAIPG